MAEDEKTPSVGTPVDTEPNSFRTLSDKLVAAPELTSTAEWPWMKVENAATGVVPAEASAKTEVLENQPLTFQRNLWDRFDFLWKNRIEPSEGLLQKVCDVLKTRAELERKYGESLLSLGETIGPEPGNSLHGAVEAMIVNFRNRGEQSLALADELDQDIIVSFECVVKQHKEATKRIYSDVQLLMKHLQDRKKAHDKCARRYGTRCAEAENAAMDSLHAASMKTQDRLKLAQQAATLSKQARLAEYDYYSAIDQANRAQSLYERQMAHVLEVLQDMEEKRGQCLRDGLRKLAVYETSWLRNMQYDLEGVAKAAEDCDAVKELQKFIESSNAEVSAGPPLVRHVAVPFHQLGKGREPRKMTPELQLHMQVQQQVRELMEEISPFIGSVLEGSETEEEVEKFCQRLSDAKLRAAFCQVVRLAVMKTDPGAEIDSSAGKNLNTAAFEALTSCFKVALDAADEHNDAWSGRDLMVLAQMYRTEQDGKAVSLLSRVYNHALWNKVTFWEDVLLLSLYEACAAESVWRRSLAAGSQFSKPAMTSFLQRFVGYMMAFGISFEQGRNSVASTLRKSTAFFGQQTVQMYHQLLLSAYEVATPEGTMGATDSLNMAMLEGLPSGGITMQPASGDLGGDDFEAVAFGVQADFSTENLGSPGAQTPSAQEASDEEDEKGEETEALRVLEEAQPKVDDVFT